MTVRTCRGCGREFRGGETFCPDDGSRLASTLQEISARASSNADTSLDSLIGTNLDGRYRVLRVIGEGGMGVVYEAEHVLIEKHVALKVLRESFSTRPDVVERFRQEAKSASRIGHPNIVDVSDFGETPTGQSYIVMEMLVGEDLADVLARDRTLPPPRAVRIAYQVARALHATHKKHIVHRDLKPENIYLIERDGQRDVVKVVDFGVAKMNDVEVAPGRKLTRTGMIFGTPEYMSPEQALGRPFDHRVDIYALGAILFELLSGRVPFEGENFMEILAKHGNSEVPTLLDVHPEIQISSTLEAIVMRTLTKDPAQRYQTMGELADALRAAPEMPGAEASTGADTLAWAVPLPAAGPPPLPRRDPTPLPGRAFEPERECGNDTPSELVTTRAALDALESTSDATEPEELRVSGAANADSYELDADFAVSVAGGVDDGPPAHGVFRIDSARDRNTQRDHADHAARDADAVDRAPAGHEKRVTPSAEFAHRNRITSPGRYSRVERAIMAERSARQEVELVARDERYGRRAASGEHAVRDEHPPVGQRYPTRRRAQLMILPALIAVVAIIVAYNFASKPTETQTSLSAATEPLVTPRAASAPTLLGVDDRTAAGPDPAREPTFVEVQIRTQPSGASVRAVGTDAHCSASPCALAVPRGRPVTLRAETETASVERTLTFEDRSEVELQVKAIGHAHSAAAATAAAAVGSKPAPLRKIPGDLKVPPMFRDP
jgi:serine/threonine protein kinase